MKPTVQAKGGRRADLDNRYFRSKMEANYARYLQWLKEKGEILDWKYEPIEFTFESIKRGAGRTYKPDFLVVKLDNSDYFEEVKGYMDAVSKTKLKRMAKYFPDVEIRIVDKARMREIAKWKKLIPGWED